MDLAKDDRFKDKFEELKGIKLEYATLEESNPLGAYSLAKRSVRLSDDFATIAYDVTMLEKLGQLPKSRPFKDRCYQIYRNLQEIHTHCRMIWKDAEKRGG